MRKGLESREEGSSFQENAGDCEVGNFGIYVGPFVSTSVYHELFAASMTGSSFE